MVKCNKLFVVMGMDSGTWDGGRMERDTRVELGVNA